MVLLQGTGKTCRVRDCPTLKFLKHSKELLDWQPVFVLLPAAPASMSDLSLHKK